MLSGINTDIEHDGKIYHVQTEDGGQQNPVIVTHLFAGGAILSSRKVSYADVLQSGPNPDVIREMMKEQHQAMIKSLASEQRSGVGRTTAAQQTASSPPTPPPSIPRGRRTLDEVIDEYLQSKRSRSA
ncbi:MAG: hypothetical protein AB1451_11645 [Nitrospirota bacterium]